jgi:hypothetical protein
LAVKLVPTFADRELSCGQHGGSPTAPFSAVAYLNIPKQIGIHDAKRSSGKREREREKEIR